MADSPPKLFVSYSWSSPEHEQWVVTLASALRESGVDVKLDKWDLKEGNDANVFMESMVADPTIQKVILICDQKYVEKADGRSGGVGTEAQIISPKLYGQVSQSKFVAVISQCNADGKPYVPIYYGSRVYIDLSNPESYATNFEQLLRWIYDKPQYVKPRLGNKPAYLSDEKQPSLETSAQFRRAIDAIRNSRQNSVGTLTEYLDTLANNFEALRIEADLTKQFDDQILESIEKFIPHRNEIIELTTAIAHYSTDSDSCKALHRFFERLIPYLDAPENVSHWRTWDFDNFKFIVQELFVYVVAIFLKHERYELAGYLLRQRYYVRHRNQNKMIHFSALSNHLDSFEARNHRLMLGRASLHADFLEGRSRTSGLEFAHLMQADFVLFFRDALDTTRLEHDQRWWPETLLYSGNQNGAFEVFARAESKSYFNALRILLDINSKADLEKVMEAFRDQKLRVPRWSWHSVAVATLCNYESLETRP